MDATRLQGPRDARVRRIDAASTAPRTSGSGDRSEPIASTTMSVGISRAGAGVLIGDTSCFFGHEDIAALVAAPHFLQARWG